MKRVRLLLACLLMVSLSAVSAKANDGLNGLGLAYLYGYNGGTGNFYRSFNATPPYFALHPPVYYGKRYTRPYGASPFAAWPQLRSAEGYAPTPHVTRAQCCGATVIVNPHHVDEPTSAPVASQGGVVSKSATQPLVIENPYFKPAVQLAKSE